MKKMTYKYCNEKGMEIGRASLIFHENFIYCELIEVLNEYRHQGIATEIIDNIRKEYNMPLRYSIVSDICTGAKFWSVYTKDKEVKQISNHTFEIEKEAN